MKLIAPGEPAFRETRFATRLLHDEPNLRIVSFDLLAGQSVPPHSSSSTVLLQVIDGTGVFRGEGSEEQLTAGMSALYAPGETHSIEASGSGLRFLAMLAPSPG